MRLAHGVSEPVVPVVPVVPEVPEVPEEIPEVPDVPEVPEVPLDPDTDGNGGPDVKPECTSPQSSRVA